jgi:hypothetical protein
VYAWEIGPGKPTAWHIDNGAAFMLVTAGGIAIDFQHETQCRWAVEPCRVIEWQIPATTRLRLGRPL